MSYASTLLRGQKLFWFCVDSLYGVSGGTVDDGNDGD